MGRHSGWHSGRSPYDYPDAFHGVVNSPWPDPRFRDLTRALIASLSADDIGDAILQHVEWRAVALGAEALRSKRPLKRIDDEEEVLRCAKASVWSTVWPF